jgi:predicted acyltransferase (DUF342 family)
MSRIRLVQTELLAALLVAFAAPAFAHDPASEGHDIDKVNGSITAEASHTYGNLETVNGSIHIESGARIDDAETVNGSIKAADNIRAGSLSTVNGSIRVGTQAQIGGAVETVNGSVFVDRGGNIARNVETVNGSIGLVDSDLDGNIETVNGDVTVGAGSHVKGGIHVEKPNTQWISVGKRKPPRIIVGPNARVDGALVFEREVKLYVHRTAKIGPVTGATAVSYDSDRAPQD